MSWRKTASAYEQLKDLAVEGRLRPGHHILPKAFSKRFQISITPVNAALRELTAEGFFDYRESQGTWTKFFTLTEQRNLHQLLLVAALPCLGWPLATAPEALGAALSGLAGRLDAAGASSAEAIVRPIEDIYAAVATATGNADLARIARNALDRTHFIRVLDLRHEGARARTLMSVRAMTDALVRQDRTLAQDEANHQLCETMGRLEDLVMQANTSAMKASFP